MKRRKLAKKRKPRKEKIEPLMFTAAHRKLESDIDRMGREAPFHVIRILGNCLVDLIFDATGEGKKGGGV